MSDAKLLGEADPSVLVASGQVEAPIDVDPAETSEWLGSLDYVAKSKGAERVRYLVKALENRARRDGVEIPIDHGYQLRLVVPCTVGVRNAKWVKSLRISEEEAKSTQ